VVSVLKFGVWVRVVLRPAWCLLVGALLRVLVWPWLEMEGHSGICSNVLGFAVSCNLVFCLGGGAASFPGRTKDRSTFRKNETLLFGASLELQSGSGTSVRISLAVVSITAIAPSGKYGQASYKPIFLMWTGIEWYPLLSPGSSSRRAC